jgi:hypothetical protein
VQIPDECFKEAIINVSKSLKENIHTMSEKKGEFQ